MTRKICISQALSDGMNCVHPANNGSGVNYPGQAHIYRQTDEQRGGIRAKRTSLLNSTPCVCDWSALDKGLDTMVNKRKKYNARFAPVSDFYERLAVVYQCVEIRFALAPVQEFRFSTVDLIESVAKSRSLTIKLAPRCLIEAIECIAGANQEDNAEGRGDRESCSCCARDHL